jgi:hypothetical protein
VQGSARSTPRGRPLHSTDLTRSVSSASLPTVHHAPAHDRQEGVSRRRRQDRLDRIGHGGRRARFPGDGGEVAPLSGPRGCRSLAEAEGPGALEGGQRERFRRRELRQPRALPAPRPSDRAGPRSPRNRSPTPIRMPAARSAARGASPWPWPRLDSGQWATDARCHGGGRCPRERAEWRGCRGVGAEDAVVVEPLQGGR